jgi:uncharacterized membrane protein YqjE
MEPAPIGIKHVAAAAKRLARRLLTIGENRLELLMMEVQEERVRLLRAILLALGVAALGLLAGITLTGMVVVLFWRQSPVTVLGALTALYGVSAIALYRRLAGLLRDWENLPATMEQLRKDREALEKVLT